MSLVSGSLRLAGPAGLAANGATVRIPSFSGVSIVVPPAPSNALMMTWPLAAVVFLLVSMLVYVLVRIART